MDWAMTMASMYGPPPGWEDSWEGDGLTLGGYGGIHADTVIVYVYIDR